MQALSVSVVNATACLLSSPFVFSGHLFINCFNVVYLARKNNFIMLCAPRWQGIMIEMVRCSEHTCPVCTMSKKIINRDLLRRRTWAKTGLLHKLGACHIGVGLDVRVTGCGMGLISVQEMTLALMPTRQIAVAGRCTFDGFNVQARLFAEFVFNFRSSSRERFYFVVCRSMLCI